MTPETGDMAHAPGSATIDPRGRAPGLVARVTPVAVVEVDVRIDAPPETVWSMVGDPVALGELTAECFDMTWVQGATGPRVGARFRGRNRSSWRRWSTTCTIVRYEPGSEIAWDVSLWPAGGGEMGLPDRTRR